MMKLKIHKAAMILAALVLLLPLRAVGQANTYYERGGVNPADSRQVLKTRMASLAIIVWSAASPMA